MNYQYHHDGTNARYTVNGTEYARLEDVPQEHRAYFENMDKNKNGIPDNVEGLLDAMNGPSGKPNLRKVIGTLFKAVGENMTSDNTQNVDFQEVKEEKTITESHRTSVEPRGTYNKSGRVVQQGESSFLPTLIKILITAAIIIGVLWYLGLIK